MTSYDPIVSSSSSSRMKELYVLKQEKVSLNNLLHKNLVIHRKPKKEQVWINCSRKAVCSIQHIKKICLTWIPKLDHLVNKSIRDYFDLLFFTFFSYFQPIMVSDEIAYNFFSMITCRQLQKSKGYIKIFKFFYKNALLTRIR